MCLLGPCHVLRSKGWVCSSWRLLSVALHGSYSWKGPILAPGMLIAYCKGSGTYWSGRSFEDSGFRLPWEVPSTTTRGATTGDVRVGSAGRPGWRHVVPRSIEGDCMWSSGYALFPWLMKTLCR